MVVQVPEVMPQTNLSRAVWDRLVSLSKRVRYDEGEMIFHEGDHALNLYIVQSGQVAIELNIPPQGNVTLATLGPGEWFSWSALLEPRIERAAARAVTPVELLAIRGGAVMDLCVEDHELGFQIYRTLADTIATRLTYSWLHLLQLLGP